jgi:hypothetical protein
MTETTITEQSTLTKRQVKFYGPKLITYCDVKASIVAEVRYDDECGNGHNSFAITGTINESGKPRSKAFLAGGCLHEEIAKHFPELASFIKWHLCSSDGPMHYVGNTVFLAGDKDCWGRRKGEASRFDYGLRFGGVPITHRVRSDKFWDFLKQETLLAKGNGQRPAFHITEFTHKDSDGRVYSPHYSFMGYAKDWASAPFRDFVEAEEVRAAFTNCDVDFVAVPVDFSEGKERELDAARRSAVWPDATDEELTAPDLKEKLSARLPALLAEMRRDVESLGLVW